MSTLRALRQLSPAAQFLAISQLAINVGFYMLLPYLASYLANDLSIAAWAVGLVMGVRTFSQQGLNLVGGVIADRLGYKVAIVAGCALRVVGFGMFVFVESLPGLVVATFLSGLAGGIFNPAVRAYLAQEAGERRAEAFAVWSVFGEAGALVGPLVGALLLGFSFQVVCGVAAVLFLVLTLLQLRILPARSDISAQDRQPLLQDWREVLANRRFVLFALGMGLGYYVLFNQLYLALPLEVRRVTGGDAGMSVLFAISSLMTIFGQVALTGWARARLGPARAIVLGLVLMGVAFLTPLAGVPSFDPAPIAALTGPAVEVVGVIVRLSGIIALTVVFSLGIMLAQPFALGMVPVLAGGRLLGTYYGVYYLALGLGSTVGNIALGYAFDIGRATGFEGLSWVLLGTLGFASAVAIAALDRTGAFADLDAPVAAAGPTPAAAGGQTAVQKG